MTEAERRASEANLLLNNPMLNKAFQQVRENLVEAIEDNPLDQDSHKDKLMMALQALKSVRSQLEMFVYEGHLAKIKPEEF